MGHESEAILKQLKSIKTWIAVGSIGFVLIGMSAILFSLSVVQMTSVFENEYSEETCKEEQSELSWENASDLFKQGKLDELSDIVEERLATHPYDASAHWFKAKLHYLKKEWNMARISIENTELYAPNWRDEYTGPLKRKMKELRQ